MRYDLMYAAGGDRNVPHDNTRRKKQNPAPRAFQSLFSMSLSSKLSSSPLRTLRLGHWHNPVLYAG